MRRTLLQVALTERATVPLLTACRHLGLHRTQVYRVSKPAAPSVARARPKPSHTLEYAERQRILDVLHSARFVDSSPAAVYYALLDEKVRLCSISTMYRLLRSTGAAMDRRQQRRSGKHPRPQLQATARNQVWSWDITLLKGPVRGVFYYLYVMLDIFSRRVVAWMLADREDEDLAKQFILEACIREGIQPGQLTIHTDRGPSMKSLAVAGLYRWLGIERSFSRPSVSDDNPYSEAHFKTLKHCPAFPGHFDDYQHALHFCRGFFRHYNSAHYHSGICYLTPDIVHAGQADEVLLRRYQTELAAYASNPKRFPAGAPRLKSLPAAVWINDPVRTNQPQLQPRA